MKQRFDYIIGADESGRGCLAGPLVAASCTILQDLEEYEVIPTVDDCKKLNEQERNSIFQYVVENPQIYAFSVHEIPANEIDETSIEEACQRALAKSIESLADSLPRRESIYGIVDGKKSPKTSISCRPFVKGDSHVYSIALASIIARVTRDKTMAEYALEYPEYQFDQNGGYSSLAHKEAIHEYGPSPIHRLNHKPVRGHIGRSQFMASSLALLALKPNEARAMYNDPKTGVAFPEVGEIEKSIPTAWSDLDNPAGEKSRFARLDSNDDSVFYTDPRFVEHVDAQAVEIMTNYISDVAITSDSQAVLDLCSSWTSHIRGNRPLKRITGVGMNAKELEANKQLTDWLVQDLNKNPALPFDDSTFDVVLCQLSIDYLTRPLEVCKEIGRVLKPTGVVHILFSNRLFLSKAVALWTGADDVDHAFTVASYLHFSKGGFTKIEAKDLSIRKNGKIVGDPMYVVRAIKS